MQQHTQKYCKLCFLVTRERIQPFPVFNPLSMGTFSQWTEILKWKGQVYRGCLWQALRRSLLKHTMFKSLTTGLHLVSSGIAFTHKLHSLKLVQMVWQVSRSVKKKKLYIYIYVYKKGQCWKRLANTMDFSSHSLSGLFAVSSVEAGACDDFPNKEKQRKKKKISGAVVVQGKELPPTLPRISSLSKLSRIENVGLSSKFLYSETCLFVSFFFFFAVVSAMQTWQNAQPFTQYAYYIFIWNPLNLSPFDKSNFSIKYYKHYRVK